MDTVGCYPVVVVVVITVAVPCVVSVIINSNSIVTQQIFGSTNTLVGFVGSFAALLICCY